MRHLFSLSFKELDKTEITNAEEPTLYNGWPVQGNVIMLAMFNTIFEMFKQALF